MPEELQVYLWICLLSTFRSFIMELTSLRFTCLLFNMFLLATGIHASLSVAWSDESGLDSQKLHESMNLTCLKSAVQACRGGVVVKWSRKSFLGTLGVLEY